MIPLICPNCAGPLPLDATSRPALVCGYCSVALVPGPDEIKQAVQTQPSGPAAEQEERRRVFRTAIINGLQPGGDAREVMRAALSEYLGSEADAVVQMILGLAHEFQDDSGIDVQNDGPALQRLAEAYLKASEALRTSSEAEINLPFLAANANGPKHFTRKVTVADMQRIAVRGALGRTLSRDTSSTASPAEAVAPATKKWWWPF